MAQSVPPSRTPTVTPSPAIAWFQASANLCVFASSTPRLLSASKFEPFGAGALANGTSLSYSLCSALFLALASRFLPTSGSRPPSGWPVCLSSIGLTATTPRADASFGSACTPILPTTSAAPAEDATLASSRSAAAGAASPSVVAKTRTVSVEPLSTCCCRSGCSLDFAPSDADLTPAGRLPAFLSGAACVADATTNSERRAARTSAVIPVVRGIITLLPLE